MSDDEPRVYTLEVPVAGAPDNPERYELEVDWRPGTFGARTPILTYTQDGFPEVCEQLFVSLDTLIALGEIAARAKQACGSSGSDDATD